MRKTNRTLSIATVLVALAALMTLGLFRVTRSVQASVPTQPGPVDTAPLPRAFGAIGTYSVSSIATDDDECLEPEFICYRVKPSETDNGAGCPGPGIGCEQWRETDSDGEVFTTAPDNDHILYLSPASKNTGKLLVVLAGGDGNPSGLINLYEVAASQGYHVIGLSNYNGGHKREDIMLEAVTGLESSDDSRLSDHPQDSIYNRLVRVLEWARDKRASDGWGRYLTAHGVDWTKVNFAGFSNGSSYVSLMGLVYPVGRVAMLGGPNDGRGDTEEKWVPADYIRRIEGVTDTHYYGLVSDKNHADKPDEDGKSPLYQIIKNWRKFGMEGPLNPPRFEFDPQPTETPDFSGSHMLIGTDPETIAEEGHVSVALDEYGTVENTYICVPTPENNYCRIGYAAAWRCVLGTGDASVSSPPVADAGPAQTVECEGGGGASVELDGSRSRDFDCDVLSYKWTGSFGVATGRKPTVFLPVGTHSITLVVSDEWSSSEPRTVSITVADTQPPSLSVTLTPTVLWPANHKLVRIDAEISAADSCDSAPPTVVLTSITSDQPDNGGGDGDTQGDIQEAAFGTFDRSFLLRAERAGGDPRGRTYKITYTATDASGNQTQKSATVHVPHSR